MHAAIAKYKELVSQNYKEPVDGNFEDVTDMILKEFESDSESTATPRTVTTNLGVIIISYYYSLKINIIYFYGIINLLFSPYSQKSQNLVLAKFYCLKVCPLGSE